MPAGALRLQAAHRVTRKRKAVMPIDVVFPQGQTTEERNEESAAMMVDSQNEATAAALTELGLPVGSERRGTSRVVRSPTPSWRKRLSRRRSFGGGITAQGRRHG